MAKNVTKRRRTWTTARCPHIKDTRKKEKTCGKHCRTLKRTEGATRQKAFSLGLSLDSRA